MNSKEARPRPRIRISRLGSWLALIPLVSSMLLLAAPAGHASSAIDPSLKVKQVTAAGCGSNEWALILAFDGIDGAGGYSTRTRVTSGGLVYMDEGVDWDVYNGTEDWNLYANASYAPTTGAWPIPAGQAMTAVFTLERPKGTVLASWTLVAASCSSMALLYNGPTSADVDGDYVATPGDQCPSLQWMTATGCPVRDRSLTLRVKHGSHKLLGKLEAAGYPALHAGQPLEIWKKKPGPDRKVRTVSTDGLGKFKVRVGQGRYYATASALIVPTAGEAAAAQSRVRRVR